MLKVTILTCAIIAAQPLAEGALAGDAAPVSLSLLWTGRFVNTTRAPVLGTMAPPADVRQAQRADTKDDPDIVGSIPADRSGGSLRDMIRLHGSAVISLCAFPGMASDDTGDSLACGGARHNRWSQKAASFNYDLSAVRPDFANAPAPYAMGWDSLPAARRP